MIVLASWRNYPELNSEQVPGPLISTNQVETYRRNSDDLRGSENAMLRL